MSSWESIDDTNSLFIKRPVGTLTILLEPGMETEIMLGMMMDGFGRSCSTHAALCNGRLLGDYRVITRTEANPLPLRLAILIFAAIRIDGYNPSSRTA